MSPLNTEAPEPSLISTLWGSASLFSKAIVNAVSAGAVMAVCSNAMLAAESWTVVPAPPDGAAEPLGAAEALPDGATDAPSLGAADADASADGAGVGGGVGPAGRG